MKKEKQELVIEILKCGKYRVGDDGKLYGYRKNIDRWVELKGNVLPGGYIQYIIFGGRGKGLRAVVYGHVLSYIFFNGVYPEGNVINHKDLNKLNNAPDNLECVSIKENVDHSYENNRVRKNGEGYCRLIRYEEIVNIKEKMALNWSKARIARWLNLDRVNVGRIVNKINNGEPLKYENPGPVRSPNAKIVKDAYLEPFQISGDVS